MPINFTDLTNIASNTGKTIEYTVKMSNTSPATEMQEPASERNDPVSAPTQTQMFTGADNSVSNFPPSSLQMVPLDQAPPLYLLPSSTQVMGQMNHEYSTEKQFHKNIEESEFEGKIANVLHNFNWQSIQQFPSRELPPQYFPSEAQLPESLFAAVKALAALTELGVCSCFLLILGSLSHALRGRYRLKYNEWEEALLGYFLILSINGRRRTQVMNRLRLPHDEYLTEIERKSATENSNAKFIKQAEKTVCDQYNQKLKQELARTDAYNYEQIFSLVEEHARTKSELIKQLKNKVRAIPRFFADDISEKKLPISMHEQGDFLSIMDTEASFITGFLSKKDSNFAPYLKGYNFEQHSTESLNQGIIVLRDPGLSILLFTQVGMLEKLLKNQIFVDKGGLARFWSYLEVQFAGIIPEALNPEAMKMYHKKIRAMLERNFTQESPRKIWTINVSDAAGKILKEFRATIRQWEDNPALEYMGGFLRKLAGSAMRLAGLIHCWRYDEPEQYSISPIDMQTGVELAKMLFDHAKYLYLPKSDNRLDNAKKIANWITRFCDGSRQSFNRRDCLQRTHLKIHEAQPALELLESLNWIARFQTRKETRYVPNPRMYDMLRESP